MQDRRLTVRELVEEMGISTGSVHSILTDDLAMRRVSTKFGPKLLTMEQKELRLKVSQDMLDYIPVVRQAPYSPDMTPCDFWLFPHLKTQLKGTRFESRDDVIRKTTAKQRGIPEMLRTKAEPPGEVCSVTRRLLRRGLG